MIAEETDANSQEKLDNEQKDSLAMENGLLVFSQGALIAFYYDTVQRSIL